MDWAAVFTEEMVKALWKLRRQLWFPSNVPSDPASACIAWVTMLSPATDPDVLSQVIRFTEKMLG